MKVDRIKINFPSNLIVSFRRVKTCFYYAPELLYSILWMCVNPCIYLLEFYQLASTQDYFIRFSVCIPQLLPLWSYRYLMPFDVLGQRIIEELPLKE